jgi:hypothetical protein
MSKIIMMPPPKPPATMAELISAIDGYRHHLTDFMVTTSVNLEHLRDAVQARLDATKP